MVGVPNIALTVQIAAHHRVAGASVMNTDKGGLHRIAAATEYTVEYGLDRYHSRYYIIDGELFIDCSGGTVQARLSILWRLNLKEYEFTSKLESWAVLIISNFLSELCWQDSSRLPLRIINYSNLKVKWVQPLFYSELLASKLGWLSGSQQHLTALR